MFPSSSANGKSCGSSWGSEVLPHQPRRVQVNSVIVNTSSDVATSSIGQQLWQWERSEPVSIDGDVDRRQSASSRWRPIEQWLTGQLCLVGERSGHGMDCEACEWAKRLFQGRLDERERWISVCPRPKRFNLGVAL